MISIERLKNDLLKFKENPLTLPKDNKYTQISALEMKKRELENVNIVDNSDGNIDYTMKNVLNEVITQEDKASLNIKIEDNINDDNNMVSENIPSESLLIYNENDVIDLPEIMKKIFGDEASNMYLYGFKNPESFFKSILLQSSFKFMLKNNSEKHNEVITYKREMAINLDSNYAKYLYKGLKFNKNDMANNLLNTNIIDYPIKTYVSDYIKSNIYLIDIVKKTYNKYNSKYDDNVVVLLYNGIYLPLLKSDNVNKFTNDELNVYIDKINDIFDFEIDNGKYGIPNNASSENIKTDNSNISESRTQNDITVVDDKDKVSNIPKNLETMTLVKLFEIAKEKGINTKTMGKTKMINKKKGDIINDIKEFYKNN